MDPAALVRANDPAVQDDCLLAPVEADSSDSNGEQHDQACEGNANADVPGDGGHHEAGDGDKDVQQHLSKTPLSLGP
jgi:hypothetical protein